MDFGSSLVTWRVIKTCNITGDVLHDSGHHNIVTDNGRALEINNLFGLGSSGIIVAMAAGASSTAAIHTQSQLVYELIGNASRKTLTNTSAALLTSADIQTISYTDGYGEPYYRKLTVQSIFNGASDGNVNQPFQEFALATSTTLPATPTSTSGVIYNRYVNASPVILTSTTTITVQVSLYF